MDIIFVREKQTGQNILSQINNNIIDRIQKAFNVTDNETESLFLPIVPKDIPFAKTSDTSGYKGINEAFNLPSYQNLEQFSWSGIFPVYKNYKSIRILSNANGYDYVEFLDERQKNRLPLRLIAFDYNKLNETATNIYQSNDLSLNNITTSAINILFDDFVLVSEFRYSIDSAKDIMYSLTLDRFNANIVDYSINLTQTSINTAKNITTRYALKTLGLI